MKLIIQIPCLNEEETLAQTLQDIPESIDGIDRIEVLVIDDGSIDRTAEVAKQSGAHHVVRLTNHQGLARAFAAGIDESLKLGADIIVNTDADNQYKGEDIARLVQPILQKKADIVVGARDMKSIESFSTIKKLVQRIGSSFVRRISHTTLPDATSGFRAYSREAGMRVNVHSDFTYTLETIIQAGVSGLKITHIQIGTNPKTRESRLCSSMGEYLARSLASMVRIYTMYKPLRVFTSIAAIFEVGGLALLARFMYFYITLVRVQTGHVQSLIIAAALLVIGFQVFLFGLLADITAKNRRLMEDVLLRTKKMELNQISTEHDV